MIEIPISSDAPYFSQEHAVFGKQYVIEFEWVEREQYWSMHVLDGEENPLVLGIRLMTNWAIVVDKHANIAFHLAARKQNTTPNLTTLRDFMLVAYEFI